MNREHPTGTERKSLNYECGWKGGDRAAWLNGKKDRKNHGESKKTLTGGGLLMEGVDAPPAHQSAGALSVSRGASVFASFPYSGNCSAACKGNNSCQNVRRNG